MSSANKNNITKYADVNRKLTRLEVDTNFQEVKNSIDDIDAIELNLTTKVNQTTLDSVQTNLQNQIDVKVDQTEYDSKIAELESAIGGSETLRTISISEFFSGDSSTTIFTLSESATSSIDVYVNDILIDSTEYSVLGTTLTFNVVPATGTNNIEVTRRISFEYYEVINNINSKLSISNNLSDLSDTSLARQHIGLDDLDKITSNYYSETEPSVTWPGMVWADGGNNLKKRRSSDDLSWIVEGKLFINNASSENIDYSNTESKLDASNVKTAIDEIYSNFKSINQIVVRPNGIVGSVLRKDGESTLTLKAGTRILVDGKYILFSVDTPVSLPVLVQGSDYSVWVSPNLTIEALEDNFETPAVAPNVGAVKIGGFHCGLVSSGTTLASGSFATTGPGMIWTQTDVDKLILINQFTIWDLTHRPKCDPRGMFSVVTDTNEVLFWCDIYFCSTEHITLGTSRFNSNVASGTVLPKIPYMFGGNGTTTYSRFSYYEASEVVAAYNKRLMNYHEFSYAAYGVTENQSLGGASATIPNTLRQPGYTSKWGGEQMTGHIWSIGGPFSSVGGTAWQADPGRGSFYGTSGLPLFGGSRVGSSNSGSRASTWNNVPWVSDWSVGVRAACDHLHL